MVKSKRKTSFSGGEFSDLIYSRNDLEKYDTGVRKARNFMVSPYGPLCNRPGTTYLGEVKTSSKTTILVPFVFSVEQAYILEFGNLYIRVWKDYGQVTSGGSPVEIVTPYVEADLKELKFSQSFDTLFITHRSYAVRELTRTSHTSWTLSTTTFGSSMNPPTGLYHSGPEEFEVGYAATSVAENGEESVLSNMDNGNQCEDPDDTSDIRWTAPASGGTPSYYNIYRKPGGITDGGNWGFIGWSSGTGFIVRHNAFTVDYSVVPPTAKTVFATTGKYPACSCFFDQRLVFAGANNEPQTIRGSRVGTYRNFNTRVLLQDDDPYTFEINAQSMNQIKWMVPLNDLIVGTPVAVFRFSPGSNSDVITPSSVNIRPQVYTGASSIDPEIIGSRMLFVGVSEQNVLELQYSYETQTYQDEDISLLANHLFHDRAIVNIAWQGHPTRALWCVMDDGGLIGCTYFKEQKVVGWHRHDTDGEFEWVTKLARPDGKTDVYFVVKRTVNGSTKRYIELFEQRSASDVTADVFLDCSLSYTSVTPFTTVSGLDHLEGETVTFVADGFEGTAEVSSGDINIPEAATSIVVGVPYTQEVELLDLDFEGKDAPLLDMKRWVKSVNLEVRDTIEGFEIGPDENNTLPVSFYGSDLVPDDPPEHFSGKKSIALLDGPGDHSRLYIKNTRPYPVTITGLTARIEYAENATLD